MNSGLAIAVALLVLLVLLVPLVACAADGGRIHAPAPTGEGETGSDEESANVRVVPYDEAFPLAFGGEVKVERSETRARFAELVEDSRCPRGAECIQAGRARVRLEVRRGNGSPTSIELATDPDRGLASAGGVTWELQAVEPSPVVGRSRVEADYVITLAIRPLRGR